MLKATVGGGLLEAAQASGTTQMQSFTLPSEDVSVWVSLGPGVLSDHCNDAPTGIELRRYDAIAGIADVTVDAPAMGGTDADQGVATIVLSNVQLQSGGETVALPTYTFPAIAIWCCRLTRVEAYIFAGSAAVRRGHGPRSVGDGRLEAAHVQQAGVTPRPPSGTRSRA